MRYYPPTTITQKSFTQTQTHTHIQRDTFTLFREHVQPCLVCWRWKLEEIWKPAWVDAAGWCSSHPRASCFQRARGPVFVICLCTQFVPSYGFRLQTYYFTMIFLRPMDHILHGPQLNGLHAVYISLLGFLGFCLMHGYLLHYDITWTQDWWLCVAKLTIYIHHSPLPQLRVFSVKLATSVSWSTQEPFRSLLD